MTQVADLHKQWMKDEKYRQAYEALEPEFELIRAEIEARASEDTDHLQTPREKAEHSLDEWIDAAIEKLNDPTHPRPKVW